ncbi:hypothetical protein RB620_24455 [Paenibacillus sp. LHD-117]|uniref:primase C-terminal domain-containing protein n=1 Tax=Paenibacillus sp. LHD-117 TaxID=3071412 RepID=UPI0027DFFA7F|nr:primase C-terminal domain-containing protein [Paenibacillus sp. LHD-117]MDQ6422588.1 hypothetical protein [Paenibacillus sp. LHD-117]
MAFAMAYKEEYQLTTEPALHEELLHYLYEGHITSMTMPNLERVFVKQNQFGWIALAKDAEAMKFKPKSARSFPVLFQRINEGFKYYRPNLSYTNKSFFKRQIRWLVGLFFDFDKEQLEALNLYSPLELIEHVESFGFRVSAVIKTSSGYHVYLPMQPMRGMWNSNKTIQQYDRVLKKIARLIGSDPHAASAEHYFRVPRPDNVVYFNPLDKPELGFYEGILELDEMPLQTNFDASVQYGKLLRQPAIQKLLNGDFAKLAIANGRKLGRNNAAFTLAIAMKHDEISIEEATDRMRVWHNQIIKDGFPFDEVERCIQHAYDGDYKFPSWRVVQALTGERLRPITPKKERAVRQDHFSEIREDLLKYLKRYKLEFHVSLSMSQRKLADTLRVKLRSLQFVIAQLKDEGVLKVESIRDGRSFVSLYILEVQSEETEINEAPEELLRQVSNGGTAGLTTLPVSIKQQAQAARYTYSTRTSVHDANTLLPLFAIGLRPLPGSRIRELLERPDTDG